MSNVDEITRSLVDLYSRLMISGRRTAAITRLRMELTGLDKERKDLHTHLGERLDELRRSGGIIDAGVLKLLEAEFESIDRVRRKIEETLSAIQSTQLEEVEVGRQEEAGGGAEGSVSAKNLLDSFQVM